MKKGKGNGQRVPRQMLFPPKSREPKTTKRARRKTPRVSQPTQMIAKLFTTLSSTAKMTSQSTKITRSGDEDEFLLELVKEYMSDDTVASKVNN